MVYSRELQSSGIRSFYWKPRETINNSCVKHSANTWESEFYSVAIVGFKQDGE
jgi:hypothetical protein